MFIAFLYVLVSNLAESEGFELGNKNYLNMG